MLLERYPGEQKAPSTVSPLHIEIKKTKVCLGPELEPLWVVWPTSQNSLKNALMILQPFTLLFLFCKNPLNTISLLASNALQSISGGPNAMKCKQIVSLESAFFSAPNACLMPKCRCQNVTAPNQFQCTERS